MVFSEPTSCVTASVSHLLDLGSTPRQSELIKRNLLKRSGQPLPNDFIKKKVDADGIKFKEQKLTRTK